MTNLLASDGRPLTAARRGPRTWLLVVAIGLGAGLLSGLFGVGGGIVMVPAFIGLLRMDARTASATSLATIVPVAAVGVVSYAFVDAVDVAAGLLVAAGAVLGAQLGSWLLARVPLILGRWMFVGFVVVVMVQLLVTIPSRHAAIDLDAWNVVGLVVLGFVVGALSGLLGVGGGVLIVPALMLLFGASGLVAKGTSLLALVPSAISGTVANLVRRTVDLSAAIVCGIAACTTTTLGSWIAATLRPDVAAVLFAVFLALVLIWTVLQSLRAAR